MRGRATTQKLNWWPLSHAISWRHRPTAANTVHTGSPLARPAYNLLYPSKKLGLPSTSVKSAKVRPELGPSNAAHGLEEQSHDDSQRLQYLPHEAKVAVELAVGDMDAEELSGLPERMAAPLDMPLGVLLSSALLRTVEIQSRP